MATPELGPLYDRNQDIDYARCVFDLARLSGRGLKLEWVG